MKIRYSAQLSINCLHDTDASAAIYAADGSVRADVAGCRHFSQGTHCFDISSAAMPAGLCMVRVIAHGIAFYKEFAYAK